MMTNNFRGSNKKIRAALSAELNVDYLEFFLSTVLPLHISAIDSDLRHAIQNTIPGLGQRLHSNGIANSTRDIANVMLILETFLNDNIPGSTPPPPVVVFEVHSILGLILSAQKKNEAAEEHFLKALWIASSSLSSTLQDELLALALHRLGKTYAVCRNYGQANCVLQKAVAKYETMKISQRQSCFAEAIDLLREAAMAIREQEEDEQRSSSELLQTVHEEQSEHFTV